jgi:hypothetical protein
MSKVAVGMGIALVGLAAYGCYFAFALVTAPSSVEEALKVSVSKLKNQALQTAVTLHPDYCSVRVRGILVGWEVNCKGIPVHFYEEVTLCQPGSSPARCGPAPPSYFNCRSYEWNIDLWGNPTNPLWSHRQFLSIEDECRPKATIENDRAKMEEFGIKPAATRVYIGPLAP